VGEPEQWHEGVFSSTIVGPTLVVRTLPYHHVRIEQLLAGLRATMRACEGQPGPNAP